MQITKNIHALRVPFRIPAGPGMDIDRFVYMFLIYTGRVWLIDTGVAPAESLIIDEIRKNGKDASGIAGIILTHSHPDHIGCAKSLQKKSTCIVAAHQAERNWIEDVDLQAKERPVPGFHALVGGSVPVSRTLKENDEIDLGAGIVLEVIETPGHSRGSISLLFRDQGVLFCGDAVPLPGQMPIYDDAAASAASLRKLKAIDAIRFLLSSWDDPRGGSAAYEALDKGGRYLDYIERAVCTVKNRASDPLTLCRDVLRELGLPPALANPLVARSFQSNLAVGSPKRNISELA